MSASELFSCATKSIIALDTYVAGARQLPHSIQTEPIAASDGTTSVLRATHALGIRNPIERQVYGLALTAFSELGHTPRVEVVTLLDQLLIQYSTSECSWGEYGTFAKLRWHPDNNELWFFKLHVARPFRHQGLGSRIVASCERLGRSLGSSRISLMSLRDAKGFWTKLDYRPHETMPRVLCKALVLPRQQLSVTLSQPQESYDHCCH